MATMHCIECDAWLSVGSAYHQAAGEWRDYAGVCAKCYDAAQAAVAMWKERAERRKTWIEDQLHDADCLAVRDAGVERPCSCGRDAALADEPPKGGEG